MGADARRLIAALLLLHGLVHLIGFVVPWQIAELAEFPYATTVLWGAVDLGATGARLLGLAWLVAALTFAAAALTVWRAPSRATRPIVAGAIVSTALCALGLPAAAAGFVIDVALLGLLVSIGLPTRPARRQLTKGWRY